MRTGEELLAAAVSRGAGEGERAEALEQLWRERSSQLVPAIKALSSPPPPPGLAGVLYKMARELPIEVLMRRGMTSRMVVSSHMINWQCWPSRQIMSSRRIS
ncbi:MAG: hypothetical protein SGPRY_005384 [Prymnesium sp.]